MEPATLHLPQRCDRIVNNAKPASVILMLLCSALKGSFIITFSLQFTKLYIIMYVISFSHG